MSKSYLKEDESEPYRTQPTPKKVNTNNAKQELTEVASGTCFSSEQEEKYRTQQKSKIAQQLGKLKNALTRSLQPPITADQNIANNRFSDLKQRALWTIYMLLGFGVFIVLGNFYCALLVLFVIMAIYGELIDLSHYKERNNEVKNYYFISWYFFFLCIYYSYVKKISDKISYLNIYSAFKFMLRYHTLICFMLYLLGFFLFIKSLTKGYYKYQFRSFAWIHIILLLFGFSSSLIIANIFNGLVWFLLPVSLVICNDTSAYIFGRMFGKTPLSPLSPKKTVEGFIGGFITTIIWCFIFSEILLHSDFLLCPMKEITWRPFTKNECDVMGLGKDYTLNYTIPFALYQITLPLKIIHFHTFFLGLFASLLAPLGGLFASGFKRAIKIKDFANLIPGHGGLTDRMDCQMLMGIFTYIWTYQFLFNYEEKKMNSIISNIKTLGSEDQYKIFMFLNQTLFG